MTRTSSAAVDLATQWLLDTRGTEPARIRRRTRLLGRLLDDDAGVAFSMAFLDRVMRAPTHSSGAAQLSHLVARRGAPRFLRWPDRVLLRIGARLAPLVPDLVMPLAERRIRRLTDHLVLDAADERLTAQLRERRAQDVQVNLNRLGEAVLGDEEAERRVERVVELLHRPDVSYVSVKVSAIAGRLNLWSFDETLERVAEPLRRLYRAADTMPAGFVNLDMEEYRDLDLTMAVLQQVLDEPEFAALDAGVVLQAYLPDSFPRLLELLAWSTERHARAGGTIKIRVVKGANLAMERVEAEMRGWPQAPYETKVEVDANWKRMLDHAFRTQHTVATRIGVGSHNLFDVAWALRLAEEREVLERVDFEMLEGMATTHADAIHEAAGSMVLYTPIVARPDFPSAIAYLFRRFEENTAPDNFLHHVFGLQPDSPDFDALRAGFEKSVEQMAAVSSDPRRTQDRTNERRTFHPDEPFANEPDTDPSLAANRAWATAAITQWSAPTFPATVRTIAEVDKTVRAAVVAAASWRTRPAEHRRAALERVAEVMARRRGEIVATMVHEAGKVVGEADVEVSEAIDFARYYARRATASTQLEGVKFDPFGVVAVTPPWNFPFAIPAGGVLAALAAGNGVVLKPPPETPMCSWLVADCCREAGLDDDLVSYVRCPDDALGRHLVAHDDVDAVVLTGAWDTARLFAGWKPARPLLAETSGKNAMIITARADIDAAVADLVQSAFGHSGQKCSAASLAIVEAGLHDDVSFQRQLRDAVTSLAVAPATELASDTGTLIRPPSEHLLRALTQLDDGESWLVEPTQRAVGGRLWTPGVKLGVRAGSWFHDTECFGPVLGVMRADDLDQAIEWQNAVAFGLTGGLWSLDPDQIATWLDRVQVGNAYVNRPITGAIVGRQPFGGWKRSVVGPGAKAGGPNYVAQLGTWTDLGGDPENLAGLEA
ncbi:MAG: bifunctional proline dehydrogenase/L-glutamate gamma-semialdehyde dehydrogenase, partial [Acidimicrobiia bacterium]|nr:bifunctional proline dehydrogenase/L-glutamate gamma-semialdehyde dehydrogenase [Acidimicrobiia bacterium]